MRLFSDSIAILSAREQPLYFAGEFEDNCPLLWKEKERKKFSFLLRQRVFTLRSLLC